MSNNEQWVLGGNCDLCRRMKYCKTECKQHKLYAQSQVASMVQQVAFKAYSDMIRAKSRK